MYKKKQIVFVNQSAGYLMIDIIDAFKDEYEERILKLDDDFKFIHTWSSSNLTD